MLGKRKKVQRRSTPSRKQTPFQESHSRFKSLNWEMTEDKGNETGPELADHPYLMWYDNSCLDGKLMALDPDLSSTTQ